MKRLAFITSNSKAMTDNFSNDEMMDKRIFSTSGLRRSDAGVTQPSVRQRLEQASNVDKNKVAELEESSDGDFPVGLSKTNGSKHRVLSPQAIKKRQQYIQDDSDSDLDEPVFHLPTQQGQRNALIDSDDDKDDEEDQKMTPSELEEVRQQEHGESFGTPVTRHRHKKRSPSRINARVHLKGNGQQRKMHWSITMNSHQY